MAAIANIQTSIENQTAAITSGFKTTNDLLTNILEVVTKNSATLIEATVASASKKDDPVTEMMRKGKFDLKGYSDLLKGRVKNSPIFMGMEMISTMAKTQGISGLVSPDQIFGSLLEYGLNKASPNLKKNMKALDDAINDTILQSLVRLGNSNNNFFSTEGMLARFFGIDTSRKSQSTERSTLEVKPVSFDTIAHESITNAIPGYLRKILVALGGEDLVYDYRSRSFKSHGAIKQDFMDNLANYNSIYQASGKVRNAIGTSNTSNMMYELLLSDLGSKSNTNKIVEKFTTAEAVEAYMKDNILGGMKLSKSEEKEFQKFVQGIASLTGSNNGIMDVALQARKQTLSRNGRVADYISNADKYNIDLSEFSDNRENEKIAIAQRYGKTIESSSISSTSSSESKFIGGVDYTNKALYQIFNRLDKGINVFKVGEAKNGRKSPFKKMGEKALPAPAGYKSKVTVDNDSTEDEPDNSLASSINEDNGPNLLQNQINEDGTVEDLSTGERFGRWAKNRGGNLRRALFSGNPEQVRAAFGAIIGDIGDVAGDKVKQGISTVDTKFGNVSGYVKHKLTGSEYSYKDENGNDVNIAKNEFGGLFGLLKDELKESFGSSKQKASNWFNTVKGYFDYGDKSNDPEDKKTASARKRLVLSSVGAFAGAGLLGGPIGLLVGAVAGNAITSMGLGGKLKEALFGYNKDGKPTGLISKVGDAIISPIKFQIGKTVAYAAGTLKKHILGPLSDIGLAIKDRITNHVDSIFDKVKKSIRGFFAKTFGKLFGAIGKGIGNLALGTKNLLSTTLPGKAIRGAIGIAGGTIGGVQNTVANKIAGKNSFHKLKDGEQFVVSKGHSYIGNDGEVHKAESDISLTGNGNNISVQTQDYIKSRRKSRKEDVANDLKESGYYSEGSGLFGKVKGFFGGDYNAWHEAELQRGKERRGRLKWYTAERQKSDAEIAAEDAARKAAEETSENTSKINDNLSELTYHATHTDGEHSIFTHDHGLHDRLDTIIDFLSEKDEMHQSSINLDNDSSEDKKEVKDVSQTMNSAVITAAATMVSSGNGEIDNSESSQMTDAIDEATKDKPDKATMSQKLKNLMKIQQKKSEEDGEKKESVFDKIKNIVSEGFSIITGSFGSAIATALAGVIGFKDLKSFYTEVIKGDMSLAEWWGEESIIGKGVLGLMNISNFIGNVGGPIVDSVSSGIETLTKNIPGIPTISPPKVSDTGPFKGIATGILGGLYFKGASAIANIISAAASVKDGLFTNISNLGKSAKLGKVAKTAAIGLAAYSYLKGPEVHENTDAAGNEIVDEDVTRGMRMPGTRLAIRSGINAVGNAAEKSTGRVIQRQLADAGITATVNSAGKLTYRQGGKFASNAAIESVTNMSKSEVSEQILKSLASNVDEVASGNKVVNFIKTAIGGMKDFLMKNKTFSKFAKAISSKFDDLLMIIAKNADNIVSKMPNKVAKIITKGATKDAASIATAGIGYAVMAFGGALSGGLTAANIFGVREADVNGPMRTIASVVVSMLNAVPGLWALELADIIIAPMTIRKFICELLYNLLGGTDDLAEKQATFSTDLSTYNSTYGTSLTVDEYNDMTNKGMFAKIFGKGAVKTDEYGRAMFDDAGQVLRTNHGIAGWFAGGEKSYARDANGEIIRDAKGNAVQAVDQYGHKLTKQNKWTNKVGNFFHDVGGWFAGKTTYETDESGNVIYDENGKPVVKSKQDNVIKRAGAGIASFVGGIGNMFTGIFAKVKGFGNKLAEEHEYAKSLLADKSSSYKDLFKITEEDPDNPMGGFMKTAIIASRLSIIPAALFKIVGRGIKSAISKIVDPIKKTIEIFSVNISAMGDIAKTGDFDALNKLTMKDVEGNPLSGTMEGILTAAKLTYYPNTAFHWLGNQISAKFEQLVGKIRNSLTTLKTNHQTLSDISKTGNFESLSSMTMMQDPENPVGGLTNAIFTIDKLIHYVPTTFHWVGGKIKSVFSSIISTVSDATGNLSDGIEEIHETAKSGDISALNGLTMTQDESNPLNGVMNGIYTITKIINYPRAAVHWVGNKVKDKFEEMSIAIQENRDILDASNEELSSIAKTGNVKDIWNSQLNLKDGDPLSGIWKASFGITKLFQTVVATFYNIGNFMSNLISNIGEWFDGKLEEAWDALGDLNPFGGPKEPTTTNEGKGGPQEASISKDILPTEAFMDDGNKEGGNPLNKDFRVTSPFGYRTHPLTGKKSMHGGIDIVPADNSKEADVGSRYNGTISKVIKHLPNSHTGNVSHNQQGNMVQIDTDSGLRIKNMHLKANSIPSNIVEGARVKVGDKIGEMGTTGSSTGNHLHYQIEKTPFGNDNRIDPVDYLNGSTITGFNTITNATHRAGTSDNSSGGFLTKFLEILKKIGSNFLNMITGGIFSNDESSDNSDGSMSISTAANISDSGNGEGIWDYLRSQGYTEEGAAGVLGNLYAESSLKPNNLQGVFETSLGHTDESYTKAVDDGSYNKGQFTNDSAGYGLAQWTYSTRKESLYDAAKNAGLSIADLKLQMPFLVNELSSYGLDDRVKNATSVTSSSNAVLMDFEKPAKAASKKSQRARYSTNFCNKYKGREVPAINNTEMGGPDESSLGESKYTTGSYKATKDIQKTYKSTYSPKLIDVKTPEIDKQKYKSTKSVDDVVALLYTVVNELAGIRTNTGSSSTLLGELNSKEFVDTGLRNSISSLGHNRNKSSKGAAMSAARTNTRMINAMARP